MHRFASIRRKTLMVFPLKFARFWFLYNQNHRLLICFFYFVTNPYLRKRFGFVIFVISIIFKNQIGTLLFLYVLCILFNLNYFLNCGPFSFYCSIHTTYSDKINLFLFDLSDFIRSLLCCLYCCIFKFFICSIFNLIFFCVC